MDKTPTWDNSVARYRYLVDQWDKGHVQELRGACYRRDANGIVEALRGRPINDVLQMAGDGLLVALDQHAPEAAELAAECETALRTRDWQGDEELADQLSAALGHGPTPMLRPLKIDLEEVAELLEGDPTEGGGWIDLDTGVGWPESIDFEEAGLCDDDLDDPDRWLQVPGEGSHHGYRDMELFIATIDDPTIADRLDIAISGKGAFRRFKDVLSRWPDELQRYFRFSEERKRGRARAWLAAQGHRPVGAPRV